MSLCPTEKNLPKRDRPCPLLTERAKQLRHSGVYSQALEDAVGTSRSEAAGSKDREEKTPSPYDSGGQGREHWVIRG